MDPAIIAAIIVAALVFLYLRVFSPRPECPPLATNPDDPLMREARKRAKATIAASSAAAATSSISGRKCEAGRAGMSTTCCW
jgi:hypothetical protein